MTTIKKDIQISKLRNLQKQNPASIIKAVTITQHGSLRTYRIAAGLLFFVQGLCFASWASRIPTIQQRLGLSDAALGIVLFALPVGSMLALPLSGWLVARFGSKKVAVTVITLYSLSLLMLGLAQNTFQLVLFLIVFGAAGNAGNIAINTQAIGVESLYKRSIMGSFHGLWSLAGFVAAAIGSLMIDQAILPILHFLLITLVIIITVTASFPFLIPDENKPGLTTSIWVKPDKSLINLGLIAFCCMICEGAMFDWSGIYFQKVVRVDAGWIGAGYTAFMLTMASGRFLADWITSQIGYNRTLQLSGILIAGGLMLSIIFPFLVTAITGFLLVGLGVAPVVPLVYGKAGKSKTLTAGVALAAVSSIGFLGFLIGPPLIGVVASIAGLKASFIIIAAMGLCVALIKKV